MSSITTETSITDGQADFLGRAAASMLDAIGDLRNAGSHELANDVARIADVANERACAHWGI